MLRKFLLGIIPLPIFACGPDMFTWNVLWSLITLPFVGLKYIFTMYPIYMIGLSFFIIIIISLILYIFKKSKENKCLK
jgi:hypothetical protein